MDKNKILERLFFTQLREARNNHTQYERELNMIRSKINDSENLIQILEQELSKLRRSNLTQATTLVRRQTTEKKHRNVDGNKDLILDVLRAEITSQGMLIKDILKLGEERDESITYRKIEIALNQLINDRCVEQTNPNNIRYKRYGLIPDKIHS